MKNEFFAHSKEGKPPEERHRLEDHLKSAAELDWKFGNAVGSSEWRNLAGFCHDLGR
jgi:hypothetical protein